MGQQYFGEGLTYVDGRLIQLTYKARTGFVYHISDPGTVIGNFSYSSTTNEGWGLTYNPDKHELIESDGSASLHFWDPDTFQEIRRLPVTRLNGVPATRMNELEYWRGRVLANVWFQDILLVINPDTGAVEKEYGKYRISR